MKAPDKTKTACPPEAGKYKPLIDLNKCEGKADCEAVCPYDVFSLRQLNDDEFRTLSMVGKVKTLFHKQKAFAVNAAACHACGLCVTACPEKAIRLVKV